ncbi:hypothetical protein EXN66_Car013828 [Channa argus]|uniref:Uncharacterized protein n=1 Tax=Channa argus TaxID=215402 RepID=A0A6G1Q6L2_CHAAH|nr:hypothetical protein EXN66_Car013828 [Channa argus]
MLLMLVVQLHLSYSLKDDAVFPQVFPQVFPNRQQHFEHGTINVSCEGLNGLKDAPTSPSCSQPPSSSITGCRNENVADPNNATYAAISVKRKDGVSRESNVSDPITSTYAVVMRRTETATERRKTAVASTVHRKRKLFNNFLFYFYPVVQRENMEVTTLCIKLFNLFLLLSARGKSSYSAQKADIPAPQVTAPEDGQESPSHPPHPGSFQLSEMLRIIFTIFYLALLVSLVGLLQCRKNKVLNLLLLLTARGKSSYSAQKAVFCFGCTAVGGVDTAVSETQSFMLFFTTPGSEAVYEHVGASVRQAAINANVTKQKRKRGCQENVADSKNVTYAAVIVKKKDRVLHVLILTGNVHHSYAGDAAVHRKTDVPSDHSCHIYSILRMVFTIVIVGLLLLLVGLFHCGKLRVTEK